MTNKEKKALKQARKYLNQETQTAQRRMQYNLERIKEYEDDILRQKNIIELAQTQLNLLKRIK